MEGAEAAVATEWAPVIVVVNLVLVAAALVVAGWWLGRGELTTGTPGTRQTLGEFVLRYFYEQAGRARKDDRGVTIVATFLVSFFLIIIAANLVAFLPVPLLNRPPTSYFSITLGLALTSVIGTLVLAALLRGPIKALKHLVWPNPLQLVSVFTDVLSLSLRLFGNIAGEYLTVLLVTSIVAWGIPLVLHVLGLIPVFVQALVFTLLTASFLAEAVAEEEKHEEEEAEAATDGATAPAVTSAGGGAMTDVTPAGESAMTRDRGPSGDDAMVAERDRGATRSMQSPLT